MGEEQASFIEGDPSEWDHLPLPDGSFTVGIDGGYVRNWLDKKHKFEVIVGKSILSFAEDEEDKTPSLKRFGFVQTLDTKSKRRLYEVLQSQDFQMNQAITFLSDGNDTLRELQWEMSPKATHILDWFHLTMKLTVLGQYGKGLVQCEAVLGEAIRDKIERLKWSLWHGQVDKALGKIDGKRNKKVAVHPCPEPLCVQDARCGEGALGPQVAIKRGRQSQVWHAVAGVGTCMNRSAEGGACAPLCSFSRLEEGRPSRQTHHPFHDKLRPRQP